MQTTYCAAFASFLLSASLLAQVPQGPGPTDAGTNSLSAAQMAALTAVAPTGVPVEMLSTNGQNILRVLLLSPPGSTPPDTAGHSPQPMTPGGCAPIPSGAIAWWPGDGNASDRYARSPGTPQNGVSWASGKVSQAFSFNSSAQQAVEIPSAALVTPSFSVEAWVNPSSRIGDIGQAWIFGQSFGRQLVVRNDPNDPNGLIVAWVVSTSPTVFYEVPGAIGIPIGAWSHLVGTWDAASQTLALCINGLHWQSAYVNITPWDSGCPFHLGGVFDPQWGSCRYVGQFFNGLIDEATYYNTALSPWDDVPSLYNAGAAGKCFTYTLAYHMATNAVFHSLGHANIDGAEHELADSYPGTIWNPDCWLLGVDGLRATSIGYWNPTQQTLVRGYPRATMVSPRHFLFAAHTMYSPTPLAFLGPPPNYDLYYANVLGQIRNLDTDIGVGILDAVPEWVGHLKVLDPNYATYLPTGPSDYVQGIGGKSSYNQPRVFSEPTCLASQYWVQWYTWEPLTPSGFGLGADWTLPIENTDSGSPLRFLIHNQLVLVSSVDNPDSAPRAVGKNRGKGPEDRR